MKNFIRQIWYSFKSLTNKIFIPFFIKMRMFKFLTLLFKFNISPMKQILPKKKAKYNIVVLGKLAGSEDLYVSQKKFNKSIIFFYCPRQFFKIIFKTIIRKHYLLYDIKYKINNHDINSSKEKLRYFLYLFLKRLTKDFKIDAFIGFNFCYKAERELHAACTKSNIPFLTLHKESVTTEYEDKFLFHIYKNSVGTYEGHKIAVYSKDEKRKLVISNISKKNKIGVVGCSRLDTCFENKIIKPKKQILYYIIDFDRGLPNRFFKIYKNDYFKKVLESHNYDPGLNWKHLHYNTMEILIDFAKKNEDVEIIIKGKQGFFDADEYKNLPSNIKVNLGGTGHEFLKDSKVVIGWNTTAILEAIAANRFILLPYFFSKKTNLLKKSQLKLNLKPKNFGYTKADFLNKLNYFLNKKYKKNRVNNKLSSLKKYLNNTNGNAGKKLNKFILENID